MTSGGNTFAIGGFESLIGTDFSDLVTLDGVLNTAALGAGNDTMTGGVDVGSTSSMAAS